MTNQPLAETPPSTEVMEKVIAKYKDWPSAGYYQSGEFAGQFHNTERYLQLRCPDPRTDLSEAMRLLGWIGKEFSILIMHGYFPNGEHRWGLEDNSYDMSYLWLHNEGYDTLDKALPLTGTPFCIAVCNLAAKCLGLSEGGA